MGDASMMALETMGPMKALRIPDHDKRRQKRARAYLVLPITEKREKKRNSFPRGVTSAKIEMSKAKLLTEISDIQIMTCEYLCKIVSLSVNRQKDPHEYHGHTRSPVRRNRHQRAMSCRLFTHHRLLDIGRIPTRDGIQSFVSIFLNKMLCQTTT